MPPPTPPIAASIAQALREPLATLEMLSNSLAGSAARDHLTAEDLRPVVREIHERAFTAQVVVQNLLCHAALSHSRPTLLRQRLDVAEVVDDVRRAIAPTLRRRHQRLRVRRAAALPEVTCDGRRVGQVLLNLLLNASKFGPSHSHIDVTLAQTTVGVRIAVGDRGPGLSADVVPEVTRLFEPYYRAPILDPELDEGVGLGLAVVKALVEAHGGRLGAENRRGGGARFWFELPH